MMTDPMSLAALQADALFTSNAAGQICYVREPGYPDEDRAPRFFMSRTEVGTLWRVRDDLPSALVQAIADACTLAVPQQKPQLRTLLTAHAPTTAEWGGPAYVIPAIVQAASAAVLITDANAALLKPHFPWKLKSPAGFRQVPIVATIVENKAVAICYCARLTDAAAEAGVETEAAFRGLGYAGQAVATWAALMRGQGRVPLYSTDWDNTASQRVADKLQLLQYAENWAIA